jgi:hypothetical protein
MSWCGVVKEDDVCKNPFVPSKNSNVNALDAPTFEKLIEFVSSSYTTRLTFEDGGAKTVSRSSAKTCPLE